MLKKNWLNAKQAAEILGCDESWVRKLCAAGTIRSWKINPKAWAIDPGSVKDYGRREFTRGRPRVGSS